MSSANRTALAAEGLSKVYRIGRARPRHDTLGEHLAYLARAPMRWARRASRHADGGGRDETFWALQDVSFEVGQGDVVGIIGRNGAGKSTLLKILSRITEPTSGRALVRGRVASLLEVGTGFHPELTGRDNIYLNGAILGMKRAEIDRRFDEIVAFAEVERFLETPVKRYSSGMYVRLAFAVAAHLETDVLLVDEVLAVGDAAFQRKCLERMGSIGRGGRTVLFVSHNMPAVQNLCSRAVLLRGGRVVLDAPVSDAIREYLAHASSSVDIAFDRGNPERGGTFAAYFTGGRVLDDEGRTTAHLVAGAPAAFELAYANPAGAGRAEAAFTLFNQLGVPVANFPMSLTGYAATDLTASGAFVCRIPRLPLPLGSYRAAVALYVDGDLADLIPSALAFEVSSSIFFPSGRVPSPEFCTCMIDHRWEHLPSPARQDAHVTRPAAREGLD